MANRRTTIELTDATEPILKRLESAGFDVRSAFNGALIVFSRITGDKQKEAISEANGVEGIKLDLGSVSPKDIKKLWADVQKIAKKVGVKIEIPKEE